MKQTMTIARSAVLSIALCTGFSSKADEYQQLTPVATYSALNTTYIVFAQNVGAHGCSHDRNSIVISTSEHSADLVKSALSIALTSIASGTPMKVYWSGCMTGGRPKVTLFGLGTTEIN